LIEIKNFDYLSELSFLQLEGTEFDKLQYCVFRQYTKDGKVYLEKKIKLRYDF